MQIHILKLTRKYLSGLTAGTGAIDTLGLKINSNRVLIWTRLNMPGSRANLLPFIKANEL